MNHSVNVRTIAETYFEGGDLEPGQNAIERMQEGLKGHLLLQNAYPENYKSEVPVRLDAVVDGYALTVQGRIDGLMLTKDTCTVEEIKTTRLPPSAVMENDNPVHWAQAEIYAHIECVQNNLPACAVRLVYADLSGSKNVYTRLYTRERLESLFVMYTRVYISRLRRQDEWLGKSLPTVRESPFPFKRFRDGQREFAAAAYRAVRDKTRVLCEAPTGIGKTAAALFPAVKALGEDLTDLVFYLTARTTGRLAAENTLSLMRKGGLNVRSVSVCAKRKLCPTPGSGCDPAVCPRAKGYFDRQKTAIEDSWSESEFGEDNIRKLADRYNLCPFELALALCQTAQVIICDYNYVFDPAVRLRRFFDRKGRYTILVDEAHNLPDRAREMYSGEIGDREIRALRRTIGAEEGRQSELYTGLTALLKALGKADECELRSELPLKLIEAAKTFTDTARRYLGLNRAYMGELTDLYFTVSQFIRVSGEFDEECYKVMVIPEGKRCRVRLWCWNPTPNISKMLKRMRGAVLFSATLSPLEHYGRLLGLEEKNGDRLLRLSSPFPKENLLSLRLNIPTRYSKREESAPEVARAIHTLALSRPGNYLACFPSHAYMNMAAEYFSALEPRVEVLMQAREMNDKAREEYLARFVPGRETSMVAFIAMGGVFSEGVDLPGDRLIGACIVGVGMPQICFERDALKLLYDSGEDSGGFETAYVYPGIGKCLQAAGRVIRTETDRGAVLFIDERYEKAEYLSLLPPQLTPKRCAINELTKTLKKFWNGAPAEV